MRFITNTDIYDMIVVEPTDVEITQKNVESVGIFYAQMYNHQQ